MSFSLAHADILKSGLMAVMLCLSVALASFAASHALQGILSGARV